MPRANARATVTKTVTVSPPANAAPVASFRYFPASPRAGQAIDFVSISYDPDGPLSHSDVGPRQRRPVRRCGGAERDARVHGRGPDGAA